MTPQPVFRILRRADQFARSLSHIELAQAMAWVTSVIALVVGAIGVLNTMFN